MVLFSWLFLKFINIDNNPDIVKTLLYLLGICSLALFHFSYINIHRDRVLLPVTSVFLSLTTTFSLLLLFFFSFFTKKTLAFFPNFHKVFLLVTILKVKAQITNISQQSFVVQINLTVLSFNKISRAPIICQATLNKTETNLCLKEAYILVRQTINNKPPPPPHSILKGKK